MSSRLFLSVLLVLAFPWLADSALLAAGKIEQCINDGTEDMWCDTKVVVTLTLSNNQGEVESLATTVLSEVEDIDGVKRNLSEPWTVTLSKSDVFIRYPLQYLQSFHSEPTELVIETTPSVFGTGGCVDDPNSNPTCGFARDGQGDEIEDSQGFCCSCSTVGTETIRGLDGTCSFLGSDAETAHCLSFGDGNERWYAAYSMLAPETYFEIEIKVYRGSGEELVREVIKLSPTNTQGTTESGDLVARLIGDLVSYTSQQSMDNYYFFIPGPLINEGTPLNDARSSNWVDNSMLIEKNAVTLDGRECDKIGVSYNAFRYQTNGCQKQQGECLNNQVEHYHDDGGYFAKDAVEEIVMQTEGVGLAGQVYFTYIEHIQQHSLVSLTISTDEISFVINRADGHLENCQIANFEALSDSGELTCSVQNDGLVEAMFRVAVLNCTNGILPINDRQLTIAAGALQLFSFEVHSTNPMDSTHSCDVKLFDSVAVQVDSQQVQFTSSEMIEDTGAQGGTGENSGSSGTGTAVQYSCASYCDSWLDAPCLVMKGCWGAIGKLVGMVVLILAVLCTSPCWCKFLCRWLSALNRSESDPVPPGSPSRSHSKRHRKKKKKKSRKEYIESSPHEVMLEMDEIGEQSERVKKPKKERSGSPSKKSRDRHREKRHRAKDEELSKKKKRRHHKRRSDDSDCSDDTDSPPKRRRKKKHRNQGHQ